MKQSVIKQWCFTNIFELIINLLRPHLGTFNKKAAGLKKRISCAKQRVSCYSLVKIGKNGKKLPVKSFGLVGKNAFILA